MTRKNEIAPQDYLAGELKAFEGLGQPLSQSVGTLFDDADIASLTEHIKRQVPERQHVLAHAPTLLSGGVLGAGLGSFTLTQSFFEKRRRVNEIKTILRNLVIVTEARAMPQVNQEVYKSAARCYAAGIITPEAWIKWRGILLWNDGACDLVPTVNAKHKFVGIAREAVRHVLERQMPASEAVISQIKGTLREVANMRLPGFEDLLRTIDDGAQVFEARHLADSHLVAADGQPNSFCLGRLPDGGPKVAVDGPEALLVLGRPGTGKSQILMHALLEMPESAIVIDIKSEFWSKTAGFRQKHFGPVYKFDLCRHDADSVALNPCDILQDDLRRASSRATMIADQIIPPSGDDPVWSLSARKLFSALLLYNAYKEPPTGNTIPAAVRLAASLHVEEELYEVINGMLDIGEKHNVRKLVKTAKQLHGVSQSEKTFQSILMNMEAAIDLFDDSDDVAAAISGDPKTGRSTFDVARLRETPGSTLYITVPATELETYAPLIRTLVKGHVEVLTEHEQPKGAPVINYIIDELPRLCVDEPFRPATHMQALGRSACLRAILCAQSYAQLEQAFGDEARSVFTSCQAVLMMQPGPDLVPILKDLIGETMNPFNGEREPLAYLHNVLRRKHRDQILVHAPGEHLAILDKLLAYQVYPDRMNWPIENN